MDIRNRDFHFQLQVNGVAQPINLHGSVTRSFSEALHRLIGLASKPNADGLRFTLICGDRPFGEVKAEDSPQTKLLAELNRSLDANPTAQQQLSESQPRASESFEEFFARLRTDLEMSESAALFIACDWFGRAQDSQLVRWLSDPKVARLIELNTRTAAFESALPSEYATLKAYVLAEFPEQAKHLRFRTA